MIDLNATNEWQHLDPETGLVFPWYTKSFLDELVRWDLKDKVVFEYGAGASTVWWARKAMAVYAVESNIDYVIELRKVISPNTRLLFTEENIDYITELYNHDRMFDIIIIDGEPITWRDDCVKPALDCLKPGGRLIIDNWLQPSVGWLPSEETQQLLSQYPVKVYAQDGHPDWKTAVFTIGRVIDNINLKEVSLLENGQYGIGYTTH